MKSKSIFSLLLSVVLLFSAGSIFLAQAQEKPKITSVKPKPITRGAELTITGNFVATKEKQEESTVEVEIDGKPVGFVVTKPGKEIVVPQITDPTSPPKRGEYERQAVVIVDEQRSNAYPFRQLKERKPMISSVKPNRITRGDRITITGNFVAKKDKPEESTVEVEIDDKPVGFVVKEAGKEISVLVETDPDSVPVRAGEYERKVVVVVDGEKSDAHTFRQMKWRAVLQPHVLIIMIVYIVLVGLIIVRAGKADSQNTAEKSKDSEPRYFKVLRSQTNQLSLSKVQMALWTVLFSFSYVILSAIFWEFLDIKEGMFWLMGISSTTAVGAKAIVLKNRPEQSKPSTLLSDYDERSKEYRLSLHRCQIAIWTLIVAAIYVFRLFDTLHLPDIPNQLLLLMGISGGAYLGFNYPKQK